MPILANLSLWPHLQTLLPEQQTWVYALLDEDEQALEPNQKSVRPRAIAMLSQMFTQEDWKMLANTAAEEMANGLLQVGHLEAVAQYGSDRL